MKHEVSRSTRLQMGLDFDHVNAALRYDDLEPIEVCADCGLEVDLNEEEDA